MNSLFEQTIMYYGRAHTVLYKIEDDVIIIMYLFNELGINKLRHFSDDDLNEIRNMIDDTVFNTPKPNTTPSYEEVSIKLAKENKKNFDEAISKVLKELRESEARSLKFHEDSLLDQFAMSAMNSILNSERPNNTIDTVAKLSYRVAKAMLKEREEYAKS